MEQDEKKGIMYAAFSYIFWGVLPIYWKWLQHVSADEILANRILWSFIFMIILLVITKKWKKFVDTLKNIKSNRKIVLSLIVASIFITLNWFIYIWAVNADHIVEASLGYYINPLISILLGVFVLKEKLSIIQIITFLLAALGVLILTLSYGHFPWIAFGLALTFGLYGLVKKVIKVDSSIGLTLETMTVTPFALMFLIYLSVKGNLTFFTGSAETDLLLIGGGVVTATPLLFFAKGAQAIPMYLLGFLQYIAPTIMLILGVFFYSEQFTKAHMWAFICIWSAIIILSVTNVYKSSKWKKTNSLSA
ncbi:EamA family transporter RarD [Heyndrickxia camelliae]|uniref:EamA family transporter RarD n=1 Tax=Heyndrickxia camelliae TaxID=1707093 RepID=A0A2N3LI61_9BACI|nr:EamA family transporter RarD [Heyndrickxia camelliae]PKR84312.1 EamA family transporter RarD [Heyndrickxia camelliae]